MTSFQGVNVLEALYANLSARRLAWTFLGREAEGIAHALNITLPATARFERQKHQFIKDELVKRATPIEPRKCNCEKAPEGFRWMRFDDPESEAPVRVYVEENVPFEFRWAITQVISEERTERFRAMFVARPEDAEVLVQYQPYDGPGRTLGVTIYFDDGTDDIDVGRPIRLVIDSNDFPPTANLDVFQTVFWHEWEHVKGNDHTPADRPQGENLLDAFYHGVFLRWGLWDEYENYRKYGNPNAT